MGVFVFVLFVLVCWPPVAFSLAFDFVVCVSWDEWVGLCLCVGLRWHYLFLQLLTLLFVCRGTVWVRRKLQIVQKFNLKV